MKRRRAGGGRCLLGALRAGVDRQLTEDGGGLRVTGRAAVHASRAQDRRRGGTLYDELGAAAGRYLDVVERQDRARTRVGVERDAVDCDDVQSDAVDRQIKVP